MTEYYYTANPGSAHDERDITARALGRELKFRTDAGVFSRDGLDPGSRLLIESVPPLSGRVLDLGCGWGPVGAFLALANPSAHLVMSDVNERAAALARDNLRANGVKNAQVVVSDGFSALEGAFDYIVTNPPIRAGKQVIYAMFDEGYERLTPGGCLLIVIRKQQGAESAMRHLKERFAEVEMIAREKGYWILSCRKEG